MFSNYPHSSALSQAADVTADVYGISVVSCGGIEQVEEVEEEEGEREGRERERERENE